MEKSESVDVFGLHGFFFFFFCCCSLLFIYLLIVNIFVSHFIAEDMGGLSVHLRYSPKISDPEVSSSFLSHLLPPEIFIDYGH